MAEKRLTLSRDQLASFLKNWEQIKQFEKLFEIVDQVEPSPDTQGIDIIAQNALSLANSTAAELLKLETTLNTYLESNPPEKNNSLAVDYIDLPELGPHVGLPRRIQWNRDDGTLDVGLYDGVVLQVGQETHYYAKNTSGAAIADGSPVMFNGTIGASGKLTFKLADASGAYPGEYLMGVATSTIAKNAFGYITAFGIVRGLDTSGTPYGEVWADGDLLYISATTPGAWTKVIPSAPAHHFPVAVVIHAAASAGSILARFKTGETLKSLSDVLISGQIQNSIIQWDAVNSRWWNPPTPKFGTSVNYTEFEADGTMVSKGLATTWVDVDFPIIIRTTGANIPTLSTLKGNVTAPQWQVNDFNMCEGQELIHPWLEGSTIYWHVHIITNGLDATARYIRWEIEWIYADVDGVLSATITDTSVDLLIPANTTDRTHLIFNISNRLMAGSKIGAHIYPRLKRVAAVGAAPTANPFCSMLQIHIETDTTGSRLIATK